MRLVLLIGLLGTQLALHSERPDRLGAATAGFVFGLVPGATTIACCEVTRQIVHGQNYYGYVPTQEQHFFRKGLLAGTTISVAALSVYAQWWGFSGASTVLIPLALLEAALKGCFFGCVS